MPHYKQTLFVEIEYPDTHVEQFKGSQSLQYGNREVHV